MAFTLIVSFALAICLSFDFVHCTGRITPLKINNTACIAENLRLTDRYICDYEGNVICIKGWTDPEHLCNTPVCDFYGEGCVHGSCIYPNVCACHIGWDGPSCNECVPLGGCKHGYCKNAMECICKPGWTGGQCDKPVCHGCENGCCHEPHKCICDFGWMGPNCTECMTLPSCKHGQCASQPFECICDEGYHGLGCSKPICRETCHPRNGYCKVPGQCLCKEGWTGPDCTECVPYPGCSGSCVNSIPWTCSDSGLPSSSLPDSWSEWTAWSDCSATCGDGTTKRHRVCPDTDGVPGYCVGDDYEQKSCIVSNCPIDGNWSRWNRWSPCSTSCGTGEKVRRRVCSNPAPKYGGSPCEGSDTDTQSCFSGPCPIDGRWSLWKSWTSCSVTCGEGTRHRERPCDSPASAHGGLDCIGARKQTEKCKDAECPIDGAWLNWSPWTDCSKTCGEGQRERVRICSEPLNGGEPCIGGPLEREVVSCFQVATCPIDGNWSSWNLWSSCSTTCGSGLIFRSRSCDNPAPSFGGEDCKGDSTDSDTCNLGECPVDGFFGQWNLWGDCTVTCGGGVQSRERICSQPQNGGADCIGDSVATRSCSVNECPIDGVWSQWSFWSDCSADCDGGQRTRARTCSGPQFGGRNCLGPDTEIENCNTNPCGNDNGVWSDWSAWSECSLTCGGGVRTRTRVCPTAGSGQFCIGTNTNTESCNIFPCSGSGSGSGGSGGGGSGSGGSGSGGSGSGGSGSGGSGSGGSGSGGSGSGGSGNGGSGSGGSGSGGSGNGGSGNGGSGNGGSGNGGSGNGGSGNGGSGGSGSGGSGNGGSGGSGSGGSGNGSGSGSGGSGNGSGSGSGGSGNGSGSGSGGSGNGSGSGSGGSGSGGSGSGGSGSGGSGSGGSGSGGSGSGGSGSGGGFGMGGSHGFVGGYGYGYNHGQIWDSGSIFGFWSQWQQWSSCSQTCGGGIRTRSRLCPAAYCQGANTQFEACNVQPCIIDIGKWTKWNHWSPCSSDCGLGYQYRLRHCPSYHCQGSSSEQKQCYAKECHGLVGIWTLWSSWTDCSVTCGSGHKSRSRSCPSGNECVGKSLEYLNCNKGYCPIDGGFSQWSNWSRCTANCIGDRGDRVRRRFCTSPMPQYGGHECVGQIKEREFCTGSIPKQETDSSQMCFHIGEK